MALEGSVNSSKYSGRYYQVQWEATQSTSTNKSTITWKLYAKGGSSSWYAERTLKVVVAGKTVFSKTARKERYTGLIDSGTVTVEHASDGTKSFKISISAAVYVSSVNCTGSKTFTLNTIARASSISSVTSPLTLGNVCNVTFTPKSTTFYYKVKFVVGSWNITQNIGKPGVTSAYTYNNYAIPIDVAKYITTATSATMTVYLYTYSDSTYGTQIGSASSTTSTVNVPTSVVPKLNSFSAKIISVENIIDTWGVAVAGHSKIRFTGSGEGAQGSSINSYVISGGLSKTVNAQSLSYDSDIITKSGDISFSCVCKDSRSRTSNEKTTDAIKFYAYSAPSILSFNATRDAENAKKVTVSANWSISSVGGHNKAKAVVQYKLPSEGESRWRNPVEISKNTPTVLPEDFDVSTSYNFRVLLRDEISPSISLEMFVPTKEVLMNFKEGGKGLGIGKICENDGLEVAFEASFEKNVDIMGDISAANLKRNVYTMDNNVVTDRGYLSASGVHSMRFYVLNPFNIVYFRGYIDGMSTSVGASSDVFTMCTFDGKFKPAYNSPLACFSANEVEAMINTSGELRIRPRTALPTSSIIYVSGMYPLNSASELFK